MTGDHASKCPECGIEFRVDFDAGGIKSFAIDRDELARRCKHNTDSNCPNIQAAIDRLRY